MTIGLRPGAIIGRLEEASMKMTRIILIAALFAMVLGGTPAVASEHDGLDELSVSVMPEYDDPRVLAIFEGTLNENATLPRTAEFFVPNSATDPQIGMACEVPEGEGHICKVYETADAGDFKSLTYNIDQARNLFFEYYWDPFTGQAEAAEGKKSFKYEFKAPANVKALSIGIQKPLKAENFVLDPPPEKTVTDQEGMDFNMYSYGSVKKDQVFTINATYVKTDPSPSKPKSNPGGEQAAGQILGSGEGQGTLQIIVLAFVILFTGGIVAVIMRSRSAPTVATAGASRSTAQGKRKTGESKGSSGAKPKFCSECGSAIAADSKFCSECGQQRL